MRLPPITTQFHFYFPGSGALQATDKQTIRLTTPTTSAIGSGSRKSKDNRPNERLGTAAPAAAVSSTPRKWKMSLFPQHQMALTETKAGFKPRNVQPYQVRVMITIIIVILPTLHVFRLRPNLDWRSLDVSAECTKDRRTGSTT